MTLIDGNSNGKKFSFLLLCLVWSEKNDSKSCNGGGGGPDRGIEWQQCSSGGKRCFCYLKENNYSVMAIELMLPRMVFPWPIRVSVLVNKHTCNSLQQQQKSTRDTKEGLGSKYKAVQRWSGMEVVKILRCHWFTGALYSNSYAYLSFITNKHTIYIDVPTSLVKWTQLRYEEILLVREVDKMIPLTP